MKINSNYTIEFREEMEEDKGLQLTILTDKKALMLTQVDIIDKSKAFVNAYNIRKVNPKTKRLSIGRVMDRLDWKIGHKLGCAKLDDKSWIVFLEEEQ